MKYSAPRERRSRAVFAGTRFFAKTRECFPGHAGKSVQRIAVAFLIGGVVKKGAELSSRQSGRRVCYHLHELFQIAFGH